MKKRLCASGSLLLILLMLVQLLSFPTAAQEDGDLQPIPSSLYLGRELLSALPNATALLFAYDQIVLGIESSQESISVYNGTDPISRDELGTVFDAYRRDYTHHFWLGNAYSFSYTPETVLALKPSYVMQGAALDAAKHAFDEAAGVYLSALDDTMTDFEKELALHDALASQVSYVINAPNAHNAYGAMVEGQAVCEGYAEALQYLLMRAGIRSFIILGESKNPNGSTPEPHAWNLVRIDGDYYHVDLTWNDQDDYPFHAYFNLSDTEIREDHTIDATLYSIPTANATAAQYFEVTGGMMNASLYSTDAVATRLKANGMITSFFVEDDPDAFRTWFGEKIREIAGKCDVSGRFTYGSMQMGKEVVLYLNACAHLSLTLVRAEEASCTQNGNIAYYVCECGKWFSDEAANREITNKNTVVLIAPGHQWTERIEDEAHLKASAPTCLSHSTYWYDCAKCDAISTTASFEGTATGAHEPENAWQHSDEKHWHVCRYCGTHRFDEEAHVFDADCDEICNLCSYVRSVSHSFGSEWLSNATNHWHACACGEKDSIGAHTDADRNLLCDVCAYNLPVTSTTAEATRTPEATDPPHSGEKTNATTAATDFEYDPDKWHVNPKSVDLDRILTYVGVGIGGLFALIILVSILKKIRNR